MPGVAAAATGLVTIPGLGTAKVDTIGQRALARLIDTAVYIGGILVTQLILAGVAQTGDDETMAGTAFLLMMLDVLFVTCYEFLTVAFMGATPGKKALGLQVVDQRNGGRPGLGASFIRILIPVLGILACGLGPLLVYLSPIFDKSGRCQGWHDSAANDLVISKK